MAESTSRDLPRSILFMCGMNSVRSPMAEVLARKLLPPHVYLASAGVRKGERDPFVDSVLAEEGLAMPDWQPRILAELEDDYFDLIITLAPEAHHAALELTRSLAVEVEYWPMPDPTVATGSRERIMGAYREVRERIKARLRERFGLLNA